MVFRKILFWTHLVAGLLAGLAIAVMCFTGTMLAFEKQLLAHVEREVRFAAAPPAGTPRLTLDDLARRVREAHPEPRATALVVSPEPLATVAFSLGREATVYANPFTGEILPPKSAGLRAFFRCMEDWHRWLALSGDHRALGKTINGLCNAAFLLLSLTGLYLWMPRQWSWRSVRAVAFFNGSLSGKARDFNWHNTIGLWSAPLLIVLTLTALPISFRWANALVYQLTGEAPPARPGPSATGTAAGPSGPPVALPPPPDDARPLSRDAQFAIVQKNFPSWQQITLRLASPGTREDSARAPHDRDRPRSSTRGEERRRSPQPSTFVVKLPDAWPRTANVTVTLNPFTGEILRREAFADLGPGQRARAWSRFLHTGEALGIAGQILAALATLAGCFLVYTGFALAWRRFFRRASP